jgi:hypothetical protein
MGAWGPRWLELEPQHIDATYVLWATCKLVDPDKVPSKGLVARIELADRPTERFWMLLGQSHAEVCSTYPGRVEDLIVRTDSQTLAHRTRRRGAGHGRGLPRRSAASLRSCSSANRPPAPVSCSARYAM